MCCRIRSRKVVFVGKSAPRQHRPKSPKASFRGPTENLVIRPIQQLRSQLSPSPTTGPRPLADYGDEMGHDFTTDQADGDVFYQGWDEILPEVPPMRIHASPHLSSTHSPSKLSFWESFSARRGERCRGRVRFWERSWLPTRPSLWLRPLRDGTMSPCKPTAARGKQEELPCGLEEAG